MRGLCSRFTKLKQESAPESELRKVAVVIESLDTQLRIERKISQLVVGIVYFYYRAGLDSVATGMQLGIKPPHVRQILNGLRLCWAKMQQGEHTMPLQHAPMIRAALKTCAFCGRQFERFRRFDGRAKYCTKKCRNENRKRRKKNNPAPVLCPECKPIEKTPAPNGANLDVLMGPQAQHDMQWLRQRLVAQPVEGYNVA